MPAYKMTHNYRPSLGAYLKSIQSKMNTINEKLSALAKESGCNLYGNFTGSIVQWSAHQCQITDDSKYPYRSQSRHGEGTTPEIAIAACHAAQFVANPSKRAESPEA